MEKIQKLPAFPKRLQRNNEPSSARLKIHVSNSQKDLPINKASVLAIVQAVMEKEKCSHSEVSIYFVGSKKISKLHAEFFDDPTPTDCISFPIDEEHLGEIFVCPKTAIQYAKKKGLDPHTETALYIIHGLLHCMGYDDLDPRARRVMRKKEKSCMALIKDLLYK